MRGRLSSKSSVTSDHPELQFAFAHDSVDPLESHNQNLLDQGFIIYSDEEMMSVSSQSYDSNLSFDSNSVAFSRRSRCTQQRNTQKNKQTSQNTLGNFTNEESSICDVRESQCSQSGRQLLHALEPLFKNKVFLRRSPRFVTYEETETQPSTSNVMMKPFKFQNTQQTPNQQNSFMIEDEKSPLNQITQILQENQQQEILMNNNFLTSNQKKPSESLMSYTEEIPSRITRSSKKINTFSSQTTSIENNREKESFGNSSTNQILSQITKDYLLTARKQKKIKKAQREKLNSAQRARQYNLRYH